MFGVFSAFPWSNFTQLLGVHFLGMISPGPDVILTLRLATRSRMHAVAAATGICLGSTVWVTLTVLGLSTLLHTHPLVLVGIQILGGCYLSWLGCKSFRSGHRDYRARARIPNSPQNSHAPSLGTVRSALFLGIGTNLSNPKIVLYLAAVLSQFLPVSAPVWQLIIFIIGMQILSVIFFFGLAVCISTEKMTRRLVNYGCWIDMMAGALFLILGVGLVIKGLYAF